MKSFHFFLVNVIIFLLLILVCEIQNSFLTAIDHKSRTIQALASVVEVGSVGDINYLDDHLNYHNIAAEEEESADGEISALFTNNYPDKTLFIYWINPQTGSSVFMTELDAGASGRMSTFANHQFYAAADANGNIRLEQIRISKDRKSYTFGSRHNSIKMKQEEETSSLVNHPFVKILNQPTTACAAKFRSLVPSTISIWFENHRGGLYQGSLELGKEYTINTYQGHVFFFTAKDDKSKEYARFTIHPNQVLYVVRDEDNPPPADLLQQHEREEAFMEQYLNATGRQWRHYYGRDGARPPPTLYMWPAEYVGQILAANNTEGQWNCAGPAAQCQTHPRNLELEVISLEPRAYIIHNFLSDFEAEEIKRIADPRMGHSTVGNDDGGGTRSSDTRTSRNAWVGRNVNFATESLYARAEQMLKIPRLDKRNTEDMQVVHYVDGQKYDAHHDWGVSGYPESRYITLLMYLTDMASPRAGGETAFPKGANGRGIKVHPGKGSAVLFYNLLPDGNGDDLALHAALPVREGEKWLANFWVWDPKRK